MRIRLVINRNGLPSMKIWWDTSSFQPGDDKTVSSLLARVSQIVPLESSKWGLEDYAVEIEGFEILHFQEVETVIREADEVVYVCPKFLGCGGNGLTLGDYSEYGHCQVQRSSSDDLVAAAKSVPPAEG